MPLAAPTTSRSVVPPPARVAPSFVPAAPRFYSYTPAAGQSRPSYTQAATGGAPLDGGRSRGEQVPVAPVKFFEGLRRPATSPLLAATASASPSNMLVHEDRLISSMQNVSAAVVAIEGIASAPGPAMRTLARRAPPIRSVPGPQYWNTVPASASAAAPPNTDLTDDSESSRTRQRAEGSSAVPDGAVPNTSPPIMRYVVKDGCVEKQQDTLQPTTVPAVAAAAMAAVKEAASKHALLPNRAAFQAEAAEASRADPYHQNDHLGDEYIIPCGRGAREYEAAMDSDIPDVHLGYEAADDRDYCYDGRGYIDG